MIRLITCGGTIDKVYFDKLSEYEVGNSEIPTLLSEMGEEFEHIEICKKDSLDMTDEDRQSVVDACDTDIPILITHGTDTIIETGKLLIDNLKSYQTIVLTGALEPFRFNRVGAAYSIGYAVGVLSVAQNAKKPFCQIAIGAKLYNPYYVVKNRDKNRFEYMGQS